MVFSALCVSSEGVANELRLMSRIDVEPGMLVPTDCTVQSRALPVSGASMIFPTFIAMPKGLSKPVCT